jgi:hypothetical protein
MKSSNLPGLSPLWLISLALILGTSVVVGLPVSIATGDQIKTSDWIGFAGSIAAGAMTLVAATLAWFAVQRQIKAQEDAEERASERSAEQRTTEFAEAKYTATIVLAHTVHAAAAVSNVTSQYIKALEEPTAIGLVQYGGRTSAGEVRPKLDAAMSQLRATINHFAVTEIWKDLGIEDKGNYLVVTSTLHTVMNIYENPPPTIGNLGLAVNQRDALTKFAIYLRAFDTELADVYDRDSKV